MARASQASPPQRAWQDLRVAMSGRVVVGDLPSMHFETDDTPEPWLALKLYCAIAQVWADNVSESSDGALRSFIGWLDPQ